MGVGWALIGGLAVSARSEPRTTRDLDLALAMGSPAEEDEVVRSLQGRGYRLNKLMVHKTGGHLSTVRLDMRGEDFQGVVADLLFGSSGIEPEIIAEAQPLEVLPRTYMPVARTGHLLALKVLSARDDRLQDYTDLKELLKVTDERELLRARQAVDLISRRGFDRGKDLIARLEELIRDGYLSP